MSRGRGRRPILWLAVFLALAGAAWVLFVEDGGDRVLGTDTADVSGGSDRKQPELLPAGAPPRIKRAGPKSVEADVEREEDASPAHPNDTKARREARIRVVDAIGRPVLRARIQVQIEWSDGGESFNEYTDRDGGTTVVWEQGRVVTLEVRVPAPGGYVRILSRRDPDGLDLEAIGEVRAQDRLQVSVRTVDPSGLPRPGQRILFRPRKLDAWAGGWWGRTSDAQGWCSLGLFARGTRIEVRPGPRGLTREQIAEPAGWEAFFVDGTDVEVVVGEAPKLRLAFPDVPAKTSLKIAVLDAETGEVLFPVQTFTRLEAPWTAPALAPDRRLEVVVLDKRHGRFARLHDVRPAHEPLEVELERGFPFSGQVKAPGLTSVGSGWVRIKGRGFEILTTVLPSGRFRLRGLPDEPLAVTATVTASVLGESASLRGAVQRGNEREVVVPVRVDVRVLGRVAGASGRFVPFAFRAHSPDWRDAPSVHCDLDGTFRVSLPPGRWRLVVRGIVENVGFVQGELDLGDIQSDRDDVIVHVR
jgi:hypothetical protein